MATRLAVPGRRDPPAAPARRRRPDVPDRRRRRAALARHPHAGGPGDAAVQARPDDGEVHARGLGAGRRLGARRRCPALLGADDDPTGFEPRHPVLAEARRRHPHWRLGRSGLVMEALVPAIIEQKVTGQEAFAGFRMLVHRYGERAPGPGAERRLWVQPTPETLRAIPSWEWLRMHIDPARSRHVVQAAASPTRWSARAGLPHDEADRRLRTLPGVGVWTAAEVRQRAHGDPDAVASATTTSPRTSAGR